MTKLWPHQQLAIDQTVNAIASGDSRILITSPTGGGKSRIACELIKHFTERNQKASLYTNRRLLIEQLSAVLDWHKISHGVRAAGYDDDSHKDVQLCSIQSENEWSLKGNEELPEAHLVLIDEAHLMTGKTARELMRRYQERGSVIVGLTATPIDLGELYDVLIVAGINSELRACGALVPAMHYGPDEPDTNTLPDTTLGADLSERQITSAIMREGIHGRVLEWFRKLNPTRRPTILFAPSVETSIGFAREFSRAGISAVHIDGEDLWVNGTVVKATKEARAELLDGSKNGTFTVLCNRFVLREGIDAPWLQHGIFATIFGSLQTYLQSGGRLLRAFPGVAHISIQDHGGNWWRHGSLNADRVWSLDYTSSMIGGMRDDEMRADPNKQPLLCPACRGVVSRIIPGNRCPLCNVEFPKFPKRIRHLIQTDGSLSEHEGPILKPRRILYVRDTIKKWTSMYWRAFKSKQGMTFRQAAGLFAHENHYWPPATLPLMPRERIDWYRRVKDVPVENLIPKEVKT
jgi:superfamily II DNA or RNA helicase